MNHAGARSNGDIRREVGKNKRLAIAGFVEGLYEVAELFVDH